MQIALPVENPSSPIKAGDSCPRLEKSDGAESFDHYLGAGEPANADRTQAKSSSTPDRQEEDKLNVEKSKHTEERDPSALGNLAALAQTFVATTTPPPLPLPAMVGVDAGLNDTPILVDTSTSSTSGTAGTLTTLPSAIAGPTNSNSVIPVGSEKAASASRPRSAGPLDLPLPNSTEAAAETPAELGLFPDSAAPFEHLAVAEAAALEQVQQSAQASPVSLAHQAAKPEVADLSALPGSTSELTATKTSNKDHKSISQEAEIDSAASEDLPEIQLTSSASVQLPGRGTRAAMERSTMSDALLTRQAKAKAAGFTPVEKGALLGSTTKGQAGASASPTASRNALNNSITGDHLSTDPTSSLASSLSGSGQPANLQETTSPTRTAAVTPSATLALDHLQQMTETMQTTGQRAVELEVRLEGDQRLTISLQMERGELKTTFKTDSHELRDALAQNWGQVSEKNTDRSLRFNPPIFESSSAQNGSMNDPRQQGGQERSAEGSSADVLRFVSLPKTAIPAARSTVTPSATGLDLYA